MFVCKAEGGQHRGSSIERDTVLAMANDHVLGKIIQVGLDGTIAPRYWTPLPSLKQWTTTMNDIQKRSQHPPNFNWSRVHKSYRNTIPGHASSQSNTFGPQPICQRNGPLLLQNKCQNCTEGQQCKGRSGRSLHGQNCAKLWQHVVAGPCYRPMGSGCWVANGTLFGGTGKGWCMDWYGFKAAVKPTPKQMKVN